MKIGSISSFGANINQRFGDSKPEKSEKKEYPKRYPPEVWKKLSKEEKDAWVNACYEASSNDNNNGR